MTEVLICKFVIKTISGTCFIGSDIKENFVKEYRSALEETKGISGVVYVFKSEKLVPRLKGSSNILYIGETGRDVWNRYNVQIDTESFWQVYSHILQNYGNIFIDVYVSSNHKTTEKNFIANYFLKHLELPPINRKG